MCPLTPHDLTHQVESNWRSLELVVSIYLELKFGEFEHIGKIIHKGNYKLIGMNSSIDS